MFYAGTRWCAKYRNLAVVLLNRLGPEKMKLAKRVLYRVKTYAFYS